MFETQKTVWQTTSENQHLEMEQFLTSFLIFGVGIVLSSLRFATEVIPVAIQMREQQLQNRRRRMEDGYYGRFVRVRQANGQLTRVA